MTSEEMVCHLICITIKSLISYLSSDQYIIIVSKNENKPFVAGFLNYCKHKEPNIKCNVWTADQIQTLIENMGHQENTADTEYYSEYYSDADDYCYETYE